MQKLDPYMEDWYRFIREKLGSDAWIPLYINKNIPKRVMIFFSFLLSPQKPRAN